MSLFPCPFFFEQLSKAIHNNFQVKYYKQRASEGGILIMSATFIHRIDRLYPHAPHICAKEQIEGWGKGH